MGTAIGAVAALLVAPASGARTRRTLRRKGEYAADYVVDAGKELAELCEDLYKRSGELVGDASHELSEKYRELYHINEARSWRMMPQGITAPPAPSARLAALFRLWPSW